MDMLFGVVEDVNKDLRSEALNMARIDSQQRKITALQIEKESYSQMINRESDRLIYYVTGLFILLGLIGFGVFKFEIYNMKTDNNNQINEAKANQQSHKDEILEIIKTFKKEFLELKINHLSNSANMFAVIGEVYKDTVPFSFWAYIQSAAERIECAILDNDIKYNLTAIISNLDFAKAAIIRLQKNPQEFNNLFTKQKDKLKTAKNGIQAIARTDDEKIATLGAEILVIFNELVAQLPESDNTVVEKS